MSETEINEAQFDNGPQESIAEPIEKSAEEQSEVLAEQAEDEQIVAEADSQEEQVEMQSTDLVLIIEALLLSSDSAISIDQIISSFESDSKPERKVVRDALHQLDTQLTGRAVELREVASGWRIQVRQLYAPYIGRLWEERPPRYSRALLETLALIVYRQPISRGEIEEIRGVSLSPGIIKTLMERDWVKVVGVREAPGRPELLGTSKVFLDDFNLKTLNELPSLPEIRDPDALGEALARLGIAPDEDVPPAEGEQVDMLAANATVEQIGESGDDFQFGNDEDVDEAAEADFDAQPDAELAANSGTEEDEPADDAQADEDLAPSTQASQG